MGSLSIGIFMMIVAVLIAGVGHAQCAPPQLDSDLDGVCDVVDNCTTFANSDQTDTDLDHSGNACDADFNNDCIIDEEDQDLFLNAVASGSGDPLYDMVEPYDGNLGTLELGVFLGALQVGGPPGPNYSGVCPTPSPVPSMGSIGLGLAAALVAGSGVLMVGRLRRSRERVRS